MGDEESMTRRRYTIEASAQTLARFCAAAASKGPADAFIYRVTPNADENEYYIVILATKPVHEALTKQRFTKSRILKLV